ncbi:hypothetical protein BJ508DRAFT_307089 [Ascobolus immersus RN42]|uniref:Ty3 transposon capsid-like protein domain-containing protein n=1 Tax=Ascobolus immersus RN42 TaxID=1160509 RepID=A0A3N4I9T0_ASCIM|nr:hypothetical protein BJ508DRAFT_307089 [Ascobolus immersus RN42]
MAKDNTARNLSSRPLESIDEVAETPLSAPTNAFSSDASSGMQAPRTPSTSAPHPYSSTLDEPPLFKDEPRRRSSLFFSTKEASTVPWYCSSYPLSDREKAAVTRDEAHSALLTAVCNTNEDLQTDLDYFANSFPDDSLTFDPMAGAIDHKFEEIRFMAQQAVAAHDALMAERDAERLHHENTVGDLEARLRTASEDNDALLRSIKSLMDKQSAHQASTIQMTGAAPVTDVTTSKALVNTQVGGPTFGAERQPGVVADITVPKAYRTQVLANPIKAFEGATDVDTIFRFVQGVEHHTRLIRTFSEAQKVEYAISYLTGSAHRWATDVFLPTAPTGVTFQAFIEALKHQYLPDNAHVHLTTKLDRLELRGSEIDRNNDQYRATLELMNAGRPEDMRESHQFYQTYLRKIKDPNIINSLKQLSLTTVGGLNLATLMRFTARLMTTKLAASGAKTGTPPSTRDSKPNSKTAGNSQRSKKPAFKAGLHVVDVEEEDEEASEVVQAVTTKPPSQRNNYPQRRCFFCNEPSHIQADCELRKDMLERVKQGKV